MTKMTHSILNVIDTLLKFRTLGCVSRSLAVSSLVLIYSIFASNTYAQEDRATETETQVTLEAPNEASISESITIDWVGPGKKGDVIAVAKIGDKKTINKTLTSRGSPLNVQMPPEPGDYEIRYILRQGRAVIATRPIKIIAAEVTLNAPEEAGISESVTINWVGPNAKGDLITVAKTGDKKTINKTLTSRGNPLTVQMPAEPGQYELRYVLRQGRTVIATRPINVTSTKVTINAPNEASISSNVSVDWVGPDTQGDVIAVAKIGDKKTINKTLTARGSPLTVQMPPEPGEYELRYILRQGRTVIATQPIKVTAAEVTLSAPDEVGISELITIDWVGPNAQGDMIAVAKIGEKKTIHKTLTTRGNPLTVQMPAEPGEYELRYILRQGRTVLNTRPITVKKSEIVLDAPIEASVGESVSVSWVGRQVQGDVIAVAKIGNKNRINSVFTPLEGPATVPMPTEPGEYELRYMLKDYTVLATRSVTVKKAEVIIDAPDTANIGEQVTVGWNGPDEQSDFIAVAEIGKKGRINFSYTRTGNPLTVQMPSKPGKYELRYVLRQGLTTLATRPITVTDVVASQLAAAIAEKKASVVLNAPVEAIVAESINIDWAGPDEEKDAIAVAKIGEKKAINSKRTSGGKPLALTMPAEPGEYELRYVLGQGRTILATRPITVRKMTLTAPDEARIGETVPISWDGPTGKHDSILVVEIGKQKPSLSGSTRGGSPFNVRMPAKPGEYEIRYYYRGGSKSTLLASRPINITPAKVALDAPDEGSVGGSISVNWEGPDENGDTIEIGKPGETKRITGNYTSRGNPLTIYMPTQSGEYELRYVFRQKRTILATRPLTVKAAKIVLDAPDEANAGESVSINWVGPDSPGDKIAVAEIGQENNISSAATSRGSPLTVKMPDTPGEYELRYILRQGPTILATQPITVKETGGILKVPLNTPINAKIATAITAVVFAFLFLPI